MGPAWRLSMMGITATILVALGMPTLQGLGDTAFLLTAIPTGILAASAARIEGVDERRAVAIIVIVGLAMRLIALPAPPLLSTDIFRYVWDGMVQGAGINPYRYVPADPALTFLRDEAVYPFINRADYAVTIYPPVAQAFFALVTRVSESALAIKLGLVACEVVTVLAILALLRRLRRPATRLAAYVWHPLTIWEIASQGHVDGLMVALVMLGLWLTLAAQRRYLGTAAVTFAAMVKPFALIVMPALWRPWDWRMILLVPALIASAYLPYLSVGWGVFGFLTTGYVQEEGLASGWGFTLLRLFRESVGEWRYDTAVYVALSLATLGGLALRAGFRQERTPARSLGDINLMVLTLLFLFSPEFPWYFLIAVPFLALVGSWPGWVLTVGGFMLYKVVDTVPSYDVRSAILAGLVAAAAVASRVRSPAGRKESPQ